MVWFSHGHSCSFSSQSTLLSLSLILSFCRVLWIFWVKRCILTSVYIVGSSSGSLEGSVILLDRNVQVCGNICGIFVATPCIMISLFPFLYALGEVQATLYSFHHYSFIFLDEYWLPHLYWDICLSFLSFFFSYLFFLCSLYSLCAWSFWWRQTIMVTKWMEYLFGGWKRMYAVRNSRCENWRVYVGACVFWSWEHETLST